MSALSTDGDIAVLVASRGGRGQRQHIVRELHRAGKSVEQVREFLKDAGYSEGHSRQLMGDARKEGMIDWPRVVESSNIKDDAQESCLEKKTASRSDSPDATEIEDQIASFDGDKEATHSKKQNKEDKGKPQKETANKRQKKSNVPETSSESSCAKVVKKSKRKTDRSDHEDVCCKSVAKESRKVCDD